VKHTPSRGIFSGSQLGYGSSINQFSGRLKNKDPFPFADEFAGFLNYLMGLAGAA
jgi:hypothetical protein